MDGNGIIDLVQTEDPTKSRVWTSDGQSYWAVFLGQASGFVENPIQWSVPSSSNVRGFYAQSGTLGPERWETQDVDGDGCRDLVRLHDPTSGEVWGAASGSPFWSVYRCDGAGFDQTAVDWSLPDVTFDRANHCSMTDGCWSLADLTGDGIRDLVHSAEAGAFRPWPTNTGPSWHVFPGSSSGYADVPLIWPVPENEHPFGFFRTESANAGVFWRLIDIDNDDEVELVQTSPYQTLAPAAVFFEAGRAAWRIFDIENSGFSTSSLWTVPLTNHSGGFFASSRTDGTHQW